MPDEGKEESVGGAGFDVLGKWRSRSYPYGGEEKARKRLSLEQQVEALELLKRGTKHARGCSTIFARSERAVPSVAEKKGEIELKTRSPGSSGKALGSRWWRGAWNEPRSSPRYVSAVECSGGAPDGGKKFSASVSRATDEENIFWFAGGASQSFGK